MKKFSGCILLFIFIPATHSSLYAQCQFSFTPEIICEGAPVSVNLPAGAQNIKWEIDGKPSTQPFPGKPGTYMLKLMCTIGTSACTTSRQVTIHPKPQIKLSLLSNNVQCYKGNQFIIKDSSESAAGIKRLKLLFDPEAYLVIAEAPARPYYYYYKAAHESKSPLSTVLTFEVEDSNGCISKVTNPFTMHTLGDLGLKVSARDIPIDCDSATVQLVNFSKASESDLLSWTWDMGDGVTYSNEYWKPDLIHKYFSPLVADVKLTVTSKDGCTEVLEIKEVAYILK